MRRYLIIVAAVLAATVPPSSPPSAAAAQATGDLDRLFDNAGVAWEMGDYVVALRTYAELLRSADGDRFVRAIALQTGELHVIEEVAPDGRNIAISPGGRYASYETTSDDNTVTRIAALWDGPRLHLELPGSGFVFAPDGNVGAYLERHETDEALAADTEADRLEEEGDDEAAREARTRADVERLRATRIVAVDLASGRRTTIQDDGLIKGSLAFSLDGNTLYAVAGAPDAEDRNDIYTVSPWSSADAGLAPLTEGEGFKSAPMPVRGGRYLVYVSPGSSPLPRPGASRFRRFGGGGGADAAIEILDLENGESRRFDGRDPVVSPDGSRLAFASESDGATEISVLELASPSGAFLADSAEPRVVYRSTDRTGSFAISPRGRSLAVQSMPREDWELFLVATEQPFVDDSDNGDEVELAEPVRLTREIQHDLNPLWLDEDTLLGAIGEGRHRRSYLYDAGNLERTRLFHNNTVRTIAPEYEWAASADGTKVLIVSERDGDTVSPERAVYLVDLTRTVTKADVLARVEKNLAAEVELRAAGEKMFAPIAESVAEAVEEVSIARMFGYQFDLFQFDSKNITQPGNALARGYLFDTFASFGYEPELQWFDTSPRGSQEPIRTANVLATLTGTENAELIYVVSSHFDSTSRGPGADDNTSGTSVLLESARVLAGRPQPYTIVFAAFTGEESGLLGSREFVRQAVENGDLIVGALNNDMMGWANDHRLDNTIRYSNPGIRDLQHAAAFLFSKLITYDALYYKSTDAAAYYEAYGDIVGGIGSYPVLGNPHYHQSHDVLETINHEQLVETAKTNVASLMLLASSPSRLKGLHVVDVDGASVVIEWEPGPENSVFEYRVRYGPEGGPYAEMRVREPRATIQGAAAGTLISVKAISERGTEGWDWAHVKPEGQPQP